MLITTKDGQVIEVQYRYSRDPGNDARHEMDSRKRSQEPIKSTFNARKMKVKTLHDSLNWLRDPQCCSCFFGYYRDGWFPGAVAVKTTLLCPFRILFHAGHWQYNLSHSDLERMYTV